MYLFTDWEFDGDVAGAIETAKGFWPEMKKHGALNMRATVAGENTIRSITVWWGSKEQLEAAVDDVRAAASKVVGTIMTDGMLGELAVELD